jgi:hypothetical protein
MYPNIYNLSLHSYKFCYNITYPQYPCKQINIDNTYEFVNLEETPKLLPKDTLEETTNTLCDYTIIQ